MATRNLDRSEWQSFFDGLSRLLEGKQADIRVESLAIGSQVAVKWLPLLGITYDPKDDLLEIALDGVDVREPVEVPLRGSADGQGIHHEDNFAAVVAARLAQPLIHGGHAAAQTAEEAEHRGVGPLQDRHIDVG